MTTLTITEATKNLGKWLSAASKGQDVGIICGSSTIALRQIEIRPATAADKTPIDYDYLWKEYGITREEADRPEKASVRRLDKEIENVKKITIENPTLGKLEKIVAAYRRAHAPARRTLEKRANRRLARAA